MPALGNQVMSAMIIWYSSKLYLLILWYGLAPEKDRNKVRKFIIIIESPTPAYTYHRSTQLKIFFLPFFLNNNCNHLTVELDIYALKSQHVGVCYETRNSGNNRRNRNFWKKMPIFQITEVTEYYEPSLTLSVVSLFLRPTIPSFNVVTFNIMVNGTPNSSNLKMSKNKLYLIIL